MGFNWKIALIILGIGFMLMFANSLFWSGERMDPACLSHYTEGMHHFENGRYESAAKAFMEVIRLNPGYASVYYHLGLSYDAGGKIDLAMQAYRKTLELKPRFWRALLSLGNAYDVIGNSQKAEELFRAALTLQPRNPDVYYQLGLAEGKNKARESAYEHLMKARELYENRNNMEGVNAVNEALSDL